MLDFNKDKAEAVKGVGVTSPASLRALLQLVSQAKEKQAWII